MNTLDKITNPITYINAHIVAFIVTVRQGNKTKHYRTIIRGLLPEAYEQHKKYKDTTKLVLDRWDSENDEIKTISKLLKSGIRLTEWSWLIAIGSGLLLIATGSVAISLVKQIGQRAIPPHGGLIEIPPISDCVKEANCIIIFQITNVNDLYSPDFEAGKLTGKFTTNSTPDDSLSIRNQGTNANEIGVDDKNVTYGGKIIGSFEGGKEAQPLVVTFNANANREIVQALLRQITYSNTSKKTTIGKRTLEFQLSDGDGGISNNLTATINIIANTNNITLNVPSAKTVKENTDLAIAGVSLTAAESQNITATIEVKNGEISVKPDVTNGLTANAISNNKTQKVTLTGTVAQINTTLADPNAITYKGKPTFSGEDPLAIAVNINNTEKGLVWPPSAQNPQPVSQNLNITVNPLNPPPVVKVPSSQITNENTNLSISGISVSDSNNKNLTVTISVSNGILTIKDNLPEGLPASNIKNNQTNTVTLTGDITKINNILADPNGVIYQGKQGEESLNVTANDNKNNISESTKITVNDNPSISVPEFVKTSDGTIITKPDALNVIQSWLKAKPQVFAPPYNLQLLEQYTTGEYLEKQKGSVDWLRAYNGYYTYGLVTLEPVGELDLNGNQIIVDVKVSQELILRVNGTIDPTNSGFTKDVYRWTLQWENSSLKIAKSEKINK